MSTASTDFEQILREALDRAPAKKSQAETDLMRLASEAAEAVSKLTGGVGKLEIDPIRPIDDFRKSYQLQIRKSSSEAPPSDLGVFRLSETGYPVDWWFSGLDWEDRPDQPDGQFSTAHDLRGNFVWLLSNPRSKLVVLVHYILQNMLH